MIMLLLRINSKSKMEVGLDQLGGTELEKKVKTATTAENYRMCNNQSAAITKYFTNQHVSHLSLLHYLYSFTCSLCVILCCCICQLPPTHNYMK